MREERLAEKPLVEGNPAPFPVGIPPPPDYIFKNRGNRLAPAQQVWGVGGSVSYIPKGAEYIAGKGNFVHYMGWGEQPAPLFPSKTVAPVEAIASINTPKRLTMSAVKFFATLNKGKINGKNRRSRLVKVFNEMCDIGLWIFYLKDEYYSGTANQVRNFVKTLLMSLGVDEEESNRTGEIFGCFFEFDNAYRGRVQDLACETSIEKLSSDFPNELKRLVDVLASRETNGGGGQAVVERFHSGTTVLKWIWRVPFVKSRIRKALHAMDLDKMKADEADFYHMILYGDYNAQGKTWEERLQVYVSYHGTDQAKWPPRILIRNTGNG